MSISKESEGFSVRGKSDFDLSGDFLREVVLGGFGGGKSSLSVFLCLTSGSPLISGPWSCFLWGGRGGGGLSPFVGDKLEVLLGGGGGWSPAPEWSYNRKECFRADTSDSVRKSLQLGQIKNYHYGPKCKDIQKLLLSPSNLT